MKNKNFNINKKYILIVILSIGLAFLCVYYLLSIARRIYYVPWLHDFMRNLKYGIGIYTIVIGTGIILSLVFFLLIRRILSAERKLKYVDEISLELQKIAQGNLNIKIPVRESNELGELTKNINKMVEQLKTSIEDERNAERDKEELITSVSHDLRTPLTSILGYLELIVNNKYKDEEELKNYINIVYNKSQRLKKLIDQLFEFTKINYNNTKAEYSDINLSELLNQLTDEFFPIFQNEKIDCRLNLPPKKIYVFGNGDMLVRAFENILTNAVRYGKNGKYIDIDLVQSNNTVIVKITNYGNTIPKHFLPFIFERFYRIEPSRSEATGGAGLGLAIAKSIIELHSGQISAYSDKEKTTFEIHLKISTVDKIIENTNLGGLC